jgi:hypothetical protein
MGVLNFFFLLFESIFEIHQIIKYVFIKQHECNNKNKILIHFLLTNQYFKSHILNYQKKEEYP